MAADSSAVEQAVSRTLRDSLERIQRSSEELHQAVNDLVSACASSRPANALPPMIRAQSSAAALSATLEVLSRFVTSAIQPSARSPFEQEISRATSLIAAELATVHVQPESAPAHQIQREHSEQDQWNPPPTALENVASPVAEPQTTSEFPPVTEAPTFREAPPAFEESGVLETAPAFEESRVSEAVPVFEEQIVLEAAPFFEEPAATEVHSAPEPIFPDEPIFVDDPVVQIPPVAQTPGEQDSHPVQAEPVFNLDSLSVEEQELHRRAYRVAKVSMQDIKMLRPEDVRLGCENKDLCFRLRDDIEKAHKEYDRRFQSIQSHPVDYFYDWMVAILAGGDSQALGEYPYPSPVLRR